jgi:hypothetical protein
VCARPFDEGGQYVVNRAELAAHMEMAERHVALGDSHLVRQRQIIVELERDGHLDACEAARELLEVFEACQRLHEATRERLLKEMAIIPRG